MLNKLNTRVIMILLAAVLIIDIGAVFMTVPSYATSTDSTQTETTTKVVLKKGQNYKLNKVLTIYKGPGKKYACVKRSKLRPSTRKHAVEDSEIAKLKKGTVVSCLKVKNRWIKIPSGWIYAGDNNVTLVKKHRD